MIIIGSTNPDNLEKALEGCISATVEAEYGERLVKGSHISLAHHGSREINICPCLYDNIKPPYNIDKIGVSHYDLDTLGGVLALLGEKPFHTSFWFAAGWIDVHGVQLNKCPYAKPEVIKYLNAYWAWSEKNRLFLNEEVQDVTEFFKKAAVVVRKILSNDPVLISDGMCG